jgi:hypothetical protein
MKKIHDRIWQVYVACFSHMSHALPQIIGRPSKNPGRVMRQTFLQISFTLLTLVFFAGPVLADQVVAPDTEIYQSHTMYLADSPYIIQGKFTIGSGGKLMIQPGVEIKFDAGAEIIVWHGGQLIARGTPTQMITFMANTEEPSPEYWRQILLYSGGNIFDFVLVRDSENGIYQDGKSSPVTNSHFLNNKFGVTLSYGASPDIMGNLFEGRNGIKVIGAYHDGQYYVPQPAIHYNMFSENGLNIHVVSKIGDISPFRIDAEQNTWGTRDLQGVQSLIFDGNDPGNEKSPYVDFNIAPELNAIGEKSAFENERMTFMVTAVNHDKDWDVIKMTTSPLPPGATFLPNDNGSGTFVWTPGSDQVGDHEVTFTVYDLLEETDMETVTIKVLSWDSDKEGDQIPPQ